MRTWVISVMVQISFVSSSPSTSFDPLPSSFVRTCFSVFVHAVWHYLELDCCPYWVTPQSVIPEGLTPRGTHFMRPGSDCSWSMSFTEEVAAMYVWQLSMNENDDRVTPNQQVVPLCVRTAMSGTYIRIASQHTRMYVRTFMCVCASAI